MTFTEPAQCQPATAQRTMLLECFECISRAGGMKSALIADERAQGALIQPDQTAQAILRNMLNFQALSSPDQ